MRFIIFNGTLKPDAESNTSKVVQMLKLAFEKLGQECKVVTLRDLNYERATKDVKDELAPHIIDIFNCDGVIFATPIWWGGHGSYIQTMFERYLQLKAVEYVDEVVPYQTEKDVIDILQTLPIDVRILGKEYKEKDFTGKDACNQRGIELYFNTRDHRFSTTDLRKRVTNGD